MTYIRIKIKHLLIISASAILLLLAVLYLQGFLLLLLGKVSEFAGNTGRAGVFYDRAVNEHPGSMGSLAAAESKLELMFKEKSFGYLCKLKISGSSTILNGAYINGNGIDSINEQYEVIAKHAVRNDTFARYTIYAGMANYFGGNSDKAVDLLQSVDYIRDSGLEQIRRLNLSAIYMDLGNMEKGYTLIKDDIEHTDRYSGIRNALNRYYCFMTGKFGLFKSMERQRDIWYQQTKDLKDTLLKPLLEINNAISGYTELAGLKYKQSRTGNVFYGRVTNEGKPMAFAIVYLKSADKRGSDSSQLGLVDGIGSFAITDGEGYFRMEDVPDGSYGMGISLEWPRVQGMAYLMYKNYDLNFEGATVIEKNISFFSPENMVKVTDVGRGRLDFKVSLPEGAEFYTITAGELQKVEDNILIPNYTFYSDRLKETEHILDTSEERRRGMLTGISSGSDGPDPHDLMEPFYHTGDYAYMVTFHDSRGNILFDSNGIYPNRQKNFIHVEGSEWSEADRLLLDKKYDAAIKLYEKMINEPEDGLHALKILAKLYNNGWVLDPKTFQLGNKDNIKALKYFQMLADRIPDSADNIKDAIATLLTEKKDYKGAIKILENMKDKGFTNRQIAHIYWSNGNFTRASEYCKKFLDATGQGADRLLMLYMMQGKNELLLDTAARFTDNGAYYVDYTNLIREYLKMDTSTYTAFFSKIRQDKPEEASKLIEGRSDDLALLYKGLLMLQKDNPGMVQYEKLYKNIYDKVKDKTIKQLMKYFGKEGVHSGFGDY